jgi:hypothetical protein
MAIYNFALIKLPRLSNELNQYCEQHNAIRTKIVNDILWAHFLPELEQQKRLSGQKISPLLEHQIKTYACMKGCSAIQVIREVLWEYFFPDEPYPAKEQVKERAKKPNIPPKITKKPEKITLMDIQAACKRAKGQVRAFEPKPIEIKVRR